MRGVRVVTNVERNAVDVGGAARRAAFCTDGEVVWSWRAHAGAKPAAMLTHRADDGGNKLVHRGELEVSRKPLRREGRELIQSSDANSAARMWTHISPSSCPRKRASSNPCR